MAFIIQLETLLQSFYQSQLPTVIQLAQQDIPDEQIVQVRLLLMRSFLLQGRYQQAQQICTTLVENYPNKPDDLLSEIHCCSAFLQIYIAGYPLPFISVARNLLQEVHDSSSSRARIKPPGDVTDLIGAHVLTTKFQSHPRI